MLCTRVANDSGIRIRFRNQHWNQSLVCWNWNRNRMMLESESTFWKTLGPESESESLATGFVIGIGIMDLGKPWNRNQN